MNEAWEGFAERARRLSPIWNIGKGMKLPPEWENYKENIVLAVLINIFERELNDDGKRKRTDIELIAKEVLYDMNLSVTDEVAERIAAGLLWYGPKEYQRAFSFDYFDPIKGEFVHHDYRYLEDDDLYRIGNQTGSTVYKLTETAQNLVFMSREIMQELSIELEQLYGYQLIKRGKFNRALGSVKDLNRKVKTLILKEEAMKREIISNPKILLQEKFNERWERDGEIKEQFKEEKERFDRINRQLYKAGDLPQYKDSLKEINELKQEYENSRSLHDKLARLYIETFELQLKIRLENPELFWNISQVSFRSDIWEDVVLEEGVNEISIEHILSPLFSPLNDFVLPLDWTWQEHDFVVRTGDEEPENADISDEEEMLLKPYKTDWERLTDLWEPIFDQLLECGYYDVTDFISMSFDNKEEWLKHKEVMDLWMVFSSQPLEIDKIDPNRDYTDEDERLVLIQKLIQRNEKFQELIGKTISSIPLDGEWVEWDEMRISPYRLTIEGEVL